MKKKVIKLELTQSGIDKAIKELQDYQKWLEDCTAKFIAEMANEGMPIADRNFANAQYDGTNDTSVKVEEREGKRYAVIATGGAVLFIEFGTGVVYPDDHPEQKFARGTYGKGKGSQRTWGYYGEPGTYGEYVRTTPKGDVYKTHGNPANACMYYTVRELEDKIEEIVRRCYV